MHAHGVHAETFRLGQPVGNIVSLLAAAFAACQLGLQELRAPIETRTFCVMPLRGGDVMRMGGCGLYPDVPALFAGFAVTRQGRAVGDDKQGQNSVQPVPPSPRGPSRVPRTSALRATRFRKGIRRMRLVKRPACQHFHRRRHIVPHHAQFHATRSHGVHMSDAHKVFVGEKARDAGTCKPGAGKIGLLQTEA